MAGHQSFEELLKKGAKELAVEISENEVTLFKKYMNLLLDWNQRINLTAITEVRDVVIKHFLDSLAVLSKVNVSINSSVIDIGTGAGFPGLPIKIVRPDLKVVLVDSLNKRVNFLNAVVEELNLRDIEVIHGRAEELGRKGELREGFDLGVSRAVAKMPVLLEYNMPFIKVGGNFVAYKGPDGPDEAQSAAKAAVELSAVLKEIIQINLPFSDDLRNLLIYGKEEKTKDRYPRKPGLPEKKPLQ